MPWSPKEMEANAGKYTDKPGGNSDAQFWERMNERDTARRNGPSDMTAASVDFFAEKIHAEKYPDGCRSTWHDMCEACAVRLGGGERDRREMVKSGGRVIGFVVKLRSGLWSGYSFSRSMGLSPLKDQAEAESYVRGTL